jgi:hypothetical protein
MPKYLPSTLVNGHLAVAICPRCKFKRYYGDLVMDPNTNQMVCSNGCKDLYDPYRLAPKEPDQITLRYPRAEEELTPPIEE